jgi:hypothetical protein
MSLAQTVSEAYGQPQQPRGVISLSRPLFQQELLPSTVTHAPPNLYLTPKKRLHLTACAKQGPITVACPTRPCSQQLPFHYCRPASATPLMPHSGIPSAPRVWMGGKTCRQRWRGAAPCWRHLRRRLHPAAAVPRPGGPWKPPSAGESSRPAPAGR